MHTGKKCFFVIFFFFFFENKNDSFLANNKIPAGGGSGSQSALCIPKNPFNYFTHKVREWLKKKITTSLLCYAFSTTAFGMFYYGSEEVTAQESQGPRPASRPMQSK